MRGSRSLLIAALVVLVGSAAPPALAAQDGALTIGVHVTLVSRWLDPAAFLSAWREKKLTGLVIGATGAAGDAAARLEPFFTKGGTDAYGTLPEIDDLELK